MLSKIIELDDHFENTGEPRCQILDIRDKHLHKYAAADVLDYAKTVTTEPGFTNVLVLAMSASEYYGPNRNGDAFSERPVRVGNSWAVAPGETLLEHYASFERQARVYRHHVNKDPLKSFGTVRKAFYNHTMHRVELFLRIDHSTGMDIINKIDDGQFPAVSMGCRIKYDVCNKCGNKAPTRAQYCEHVDGSNPAFGMNRLMPNGERNFVWNPSPNLFDISFVFKPADKLGFMMKKVAYEAPYSLRMSADLGEEAANLEEKRSSLLKLSDIDKIVSGDVVDPRMTPNLDGAEQQAVQHTKTIVAPWMRAGVPNVSIEVMRKAGPCTLPQFASSMMSLGMVPSVAEIFRFVCAQMGLEPDAEVEASLSGTQGVLAGILSRTPQVIGALEDAGLAKVGSQYVRPDLVQALRPYQEKRALAKDYLMRRYVPEGMGNVVSSSGVGGADEAYYTPTWQSLHYDDPESGKTYMSTRRSAEKADLSNKKKELVEAAGIAAGSGLAYKLLSARHKAFAAPAALGVLMGGGAIMDTTKTPTMRTREGVDIPINADLIEKRSGYDNLLRVGLPIAGGSLMTAMMAQENGYAPPGIQQMAANNPAAMWLANTAALSGAGHGVGALAKGGQRLASRTQQVAKNLFDAAPSLQKVAGMRQDEVDVASAIDIIGNALLR